MSTYTQIHIRQDPEIHPGNEDARLGKSIMITIDSSSLLSNVDICTPTIAEMRDFAVSIIAICDKAVRERLLSGRHGFAMFTPEGNEAVLKALKSLDKFDYEQIEKVQAIVKDQGYPEVYDTAVREILYDYMDAKNGSVR
jgi:hypothetical protein